MMYRFSANHHVVGYALVFCCRRHPNTNYLHLMNMVCDNLQLYFQQERFTSRSSSEIYEPVLTGILEHPDIPEKQLEAQRLHTGSEPEGTLCTGPISYTDTVQLPFSLCQLESEDFCPPAETFVYNNTLYVLRDNMDRRDFTGFLAENEKKIFADVFREHFVTCGISLTFFSLTIFPRQSASAGKPCVSAGSFLPIPSPFINLKTRLSIISF